MLQLDTFTAALLIVLLLIIVYFAWLRPRMSGFDPMSAPRTMPPPAMPAPFVPNSNDHDAYIKSVGLESTVEEEHKKWLGEIPHTTTTSSHDIVLDGDRDPVPWIGLRRPKYQEVIPDYADVRVEPTEQPEFMPQNKPYLLV